MMREPNRWLRIGLALAAAGLVVLALGGCRGGYPLRPEHQKVRLAPVADRAGPDVAARATLQHKPRRDSREYNGAVAAAAAFAFIVLMALVLACGAQLKNHIVIRKEADDEEERDDTNRLSGGGGR